MNPLPKKVRFYWWLTRAFVTKNAKFILMSFVISFISIFFFLSISPYISAIFLKRKEIIGMVGTYSTKNVPPEITTLISNPLVNVTPKGEMIPVLAEFWSLSDDKKVYRFHLKKNIVWDDKKGFTAGDIVFDFKDGVRVDVVDDYTIDFILKDKLDIFPVYLTKPITKKSLTGVGGVYSVQSYKSKKGKIEVINLLPNQKGLPYKVFRFYKSEDDLVNAYKKGEITKFDTSNENIVKVFSAWNNTAVNKTIDYTKIMTIFFNMESNIFSNRDMRKVVAYAADDYKANGVPANGPIPPSSWAYFDDVKQYSHDLERAKSTLDKAETASKSATIQLRTFYDYADVADALKKNLEQIGMKVELKLLSYVPTEFDMFLTVWDAPEDPDQYFRWHSTQHETNITKFNSQKVDQLLETGRQYVNVQQRKKIYRDFQKVMADELPAYFIYHPYTYTISRK